MLQQIYKSFDTTNDNLTAVRESYFIIILDMDALIIASVFQRCQVKNKQASSHSPWEESPLKWLGSVEPKCFKLVPTPQMIKESKKATNNISHNLSLSLSLSEIEYFVFGWIVSAMCQTFSASLSS